MEVTKTRAKSIDEVRIAACAPRLGGRLAIHFVRCHAGLSKPPFGRQLRLPFHAAPSR